MAYVGHVKEGVVIFDGSQRPPDGAVVRVEEVSKDQSRSWGEVLKDLIGTAEGLPKDLADNHDHYIHGAPT